MMMKRLAVTAIIRTEDKEINELPAIGYPINPP